MKKTRKFTALALTIVIFMSMGCLGTFAQDEIPADLPKGTIKIADGIYKYTPPMATYNSRHWTNIGTVPALGTIIQPSAFNNIVVDPGDNYLCVSASDVIRINFVGGTQSVFGSNVMSWPAIGGPERSIYFIGTAGNNFVVNRSYQLQCTSQIASSLRNVEFRFYTYPTQTEFE